MNTRDKRDGDEKAQTDDEYGTGRRGFKYRNFISPTDLSVSQVFRVGNYNIFIGMKIDSFRHSFKLYFLPKIQLKYFLNDTN